MWATEDAPVLQSKFKGYLSASNEFYGLGPRFDAIENLWFTGTWFSVPTGYLNQWSNSSYDVPLSKAGRLALVASNPQRSGFDSHTQDFDSSLLSKDPESGWFSFWMPSLRYVERNMRLGINLRPCEAGREAPSSDQYVVKFTLLWANPKGAQEIKAVQKLLRMEEHLLKTGKVMLQDLPGGEHVLNGPISGEQTYEIFHTDGEMLVDLNCDKFLGAKVSSNPICDGTVWFKNTGLVARIRFPSDRGQFGDEELWRFPIEAVAKLVKKFNQN